MDENSVLFIIIKFIIFNIDMLFVMKVNEYDANENRYIYVKILINFMEYFEKL